MTPPESGTWVQETVVLRVVGKAVLPFILLFAFYVQFHGDYGPGGGFQAGVIFAAGIILAHQDWTRMKCGSGLSVATAYGAIKSLLDLHYQ